MAGSKLMSPTATSGVVLSQSWAWKASAAPEVHDFWKKPPPSATYAPQPVQTGLASAEPHRLPADVEAMAQTSLLFQELDIKTPDCRGTKNEA